MERSRFDYLRDFNGIAELRNIRMEGKTYRVENVDKFGRMKLRRIVYFCDCINGEFDSFDKCSDELREGIYNSDDDSCDVLSNAEVEEKFIGEPFWMHYKDIVED